MSEKLREALEDLRQWFYCRSIDDQVSELEQAEAYRQLDKINAALSEAPSPWVEIKSEGLPKVDGMYPVRDYAGEYRLVRFDSARQASREYWYDAILNYVPTPIPEYKEPK